MYYINIYDKNGKPVIKAEPFITLNSHLQSAYYKHGLTSPNYAVFQSKEAALEDANKRGY